MANSLRFLFLKGQKNTKHKNVSAVYHHQVSGPLHLAFEAGGLFRKNIFTKDITLYGEVAPTFKIENQLFYAYVSQGVSYLSKKTNHLVTKYQFPTTVGFGLNSSRGQLGLVYKHLSNGSTSRRNIGADFFGVVVSLKL